MAQFEEVLKIPKNRVGAVIGPNGQTKKNIEKKTKTRLEIDSEKGEVIVRSRATNATGFYTGMDIIRAIGRGFSPEHAFLLLDSQNALEIVFISDWVKGSEKEFNTKRGRIIGRNGKAREEIEDHTDCVISVQGKTIAIIGKTENVSKAKRAIEMLLTGARHAKVFEFLGKKHQTEFEW